MIEYVKSFPVSRLHFPPRDEGDAPCSAVWHPVQPPGATGPLWGPFCSVLRFAWSWRCTLWFDAWVAGREECQLSQLRVALNSIKL